jgi:hypothetical protein
VFWRGGGRRTPSTGVYCKARRRRCCTDRGVHCRGLPPDCRGGTGQAQLWDHSLRGQLPNSALWIEALSQVSGVFPATARNGEILFGQLHKRNSGWDRLNGSMNGSVNNLTSLLFREGVLRDDDEPLLLGGRSTLILSPLVLPFSRISLELLNATCSPFV